jgi:hypothetical protein
MRRVDNEISPICQAEIFIGKSAMKAPRLFQHDFFQQRLQLRATSYEIGRSSFDFRQQPIGSFFCGGQLPDKNFVR